MKTEDPLVSVYVAASLDGFIARKDGNLDWLDEANTRVPAGEDCGFAAFFNSVDALVMGRNTFEKVRSIGEWPYGDTPVVVLSHSPISSPDPLPASVRHLSGSLEQIISQLVDEGLCRLYIDGGATIQQFIAAGVVDEITITTIPILLGQGIALFGPLSADIQLSHINTMVYDFGFVQHHYRVNRDQ